MKKKFFILAVCLFSLLLAAGIAGTEERINLALNAEVKVSTSVEAFGWHAVYLTNGMREFDEENVIRGWSSAIRYFNPEIARENSTQWAKIDLGSVYTIAEVVLCPRPDGSAAGNYFPIDYVIQTAVDPAAWEQENESDDHWTTVVAVTDAPKPEDGAPVVHTFDPVEARYVRVKATNLREGGDGFVFQLAELEVY